MNIGMVLNAQNVNIPDANFKAYLVGNSEINTNGDAEIQVSEAAAFSGEIDCADMDITDLTGIEAFTALTVLYCHNNDLTSLDVIANTALVELYCDGNDLSLLDVSANTALTQLFCSGNELTALDVSSNTLLDRLVCPFNDLIVLDVSSNTVLTGLSCGFNQLVSLNAQNGNNMNFIALATANNPDLICIQVDDAAYSNTNWTDEFYFGKDEQTSYSENCGTTGIPEPVSNKLSFYPNPTRGLVYFSELTNVQLTNATGQLIMERKNVNTLDISDQPTGIYFITHIDKNGQVVQKSKVVKE